MVSKFQKFIEKEGLFLDSHVILLACSGGIDSMVLADLLLANKNNVALAHINHQTRGAESDEDAVFVEEFANKNKIAFHTISAPLEQLAKDQGENFHAHARNFRYKWLEKIKNTHGYDFIATAHHKSDTIETFFINLLRGTGLDGLTGIPLRNKSIIRPLLFASRAEIETYATKFNIEYREDSSNQSLKYKRNTIRKQLLPAIGAIDKDSPERIYDTIKNLHASKKLMDELITNTEIVERDEEGCLIHIDKLKAYKNIDELLFHLLKTYGFNYSQCQLISKSLNNIGNEFLSSSHKLLVDRKTLIIMPLFNKSLGKLIIHELGNYSVGGKLIDISLTNKKEVHNNKVEYLDAAKVKFPITLRTWKAGDIFCPLGMGGKSQKVKDFLINNKVNRFDKENILVLTCEDKIMSILSWRIDDRYKYDESTQQYLRIQIEPAV